MIRFGTEIETRYLDEEGSTVDYIRNNKDFNIHSAFKRVNIRIRVSSKTQETSEYLKWSEMVEEKRKEGTLVSKDADTKPMFAIEYPKTNIDGSYFVICSYTEIM